MPASRRALLLAVAAAAICVAVASYYVAGSLYREPDVRWVKKSRRTATTTTTTSPARPVYTPRRHPGMVFSELPEHLRNPRWDVVSEYVVNLNKTQFESFFRIAVERTGYLVIEYKADVSWWETRLYVEAIGRQFYRLYEMYFMGTGNLYDYTYMERGYTLFKINITPLLKALEKYERDAVVEVFPSVSTLTAEIITCRLYYNYSRRSLEVMGCDVKKIRGFACGDICWETIIGPLLFSFIDEIRSELVREVLNNRTSWHPYELALHIRDWFVRNTRYEQNHQRRRHTYHALAFYNGKEGVCRDYAVFAAAVLGAGGVREVYLIQFRTPRGYLHIVTGVEVNGSLYIIDMKEPVVEWNSYVRYINAPVNEKMVVFRLRLDENGKPLSLEATWVKPERYMEEETARIVYYGEEPEEEIID